MCVAVFLLALPPHGIRAEPAPGAGGQTQTEAKSAFESAKELGTADAWNAFLSSYPTGFYADMARAYLKKIADPPPTVVEQPQEQTLPPSSARAGERPCSERGELRPQHSREPTKITFVNTSGMYRGLMVIDSDGKLQDYGGVNSGDQVTFDTFRTHPWMIVTGPGDCLQIFLPAAEPATVELHRLEADDGAQSKPAARKEKQPEEKAVSKKPLTCAKTYKLQNGKCVLLQNCGKNAYRSAEGDCYCTKGYVKKGGKCVWPQDSKGFEVAPWKKSGCKTWQAQCGQGNAGACGKYEANCQVN